MSGIFGIFNRNGKPVSPKIVHKMLDAMSYWEPDDCGTWIDGPVALGHTMLWNTPESKFEHLPNTNCNLCITIDARIDNRDELADKLEMTDISSDQVTDSDFVLAAYRKWGEDCPKYLLGDFAFAIWDKIKQQLFCARDHVGIKSFYYYSDDSRFVFANDIRGVVAHSGISKKISDEEVAVYLSVGDLYHTEKTFYESLRKLPPATVMTITSSEKRLVKYWRAEQSPEVSFSNIDEYAITLRRLLDDAVKKRLRSEYPVASHLSGGLDSSTIATIAARHLRTQGKKLQAYNWVPAPKQGDDPGYYEWSNSREIAESENIEHSYIDLSPEIMCDMLLKQNIAMNGTEGLMYEFSVREKAKKANVHTILSGWGGDELITYGARTRYSALMHERKFIELIKELYATAQKSKNVFRSFVSQIYHRILTPLVPQSLYCFLPGTECGPKDYLTCATEDFAKKAHNTAIPKTEFKMNSFRQDQLDLFNQGHIVNRIESWNSSGFKDRIEYAYPLLDKRIVEFALGIPSELYYQNTRSRYLFRYAIEGILPETIQWGSYKDEPNRVEQLYEICEAAVKLWLEKRREDKKISTRYIEYEAVKQLILSLNNATSINIDARYDTIDTIFLSILVLNLD
jgi:asparagine synthase (glutamine-hydrolysing)